ncbi:hypothetical protein D3C87_1953910 [compost metagenome]
MEKTGNVVKSMRKHSSSTVNREVMPMADRKVIQVILTMDNFLISLNKCLVAELVVEEEIISVVKT